MRFRIRTTVLQIAESTGETARDPATALAVLRAIFATLDEDREHLVVLALDAQNHVRGYKTTSTGTATQGLVGPREVFRDALSLGAVSIVIAHNHPSGDAVPSPEDRETTKRLCEAGRLLGIDVRDHIILGNQPFSFHEHGLMP